MKSLFLAALFLTSFSIISCNSQQEDPNESITKKMLENNPRLPALPPSGVMNPLLIGKWQVDSAGFINNGVQTPLDAPLVDSYFEFTEDGKLKLSGNIDLTTSVTIVNNSFKLNMGGTELDYRIKSVTDKELVLLSTIVDTKEMKMEAISKFKRVK